MTEEHSSAAFEPMIIGQVDEQGRPTGVVITVARVDRNEEALLVFRGSRDAHLWQAHTGLHDSEEVYGIFSMPREGFSALIEEHGYRWVAVHRPWTNNGEHPGMDFLEASEFLEMLEDRPAGSP